VDIRTRLLVVDTGNGFVSVWLDARVTRRNDERIVDPKSLLVQFGLS